MRKLSYLATLFMIYLIHEKGVENCPFFAD